MLNQFGLMADQIAADKLSAVKQVYHKWGVILRRALKDLSPVDRGLLQSSIKFRVHAPRRVKDIGNTVRLVVGIININPVSYSYILRYLKAIVTGEIGPRFVPMKTKGGKYTGILGWAKRYNLVEYMSSEKGYGRMDWRWANGINKYRLFTGITVHHKGNNMFSVVYNRYQQQIINEVQEVIMRGIN